MVLLQIDLDNDLDKKVRLKAIEYGVSNKADAVVNILREVL